MKINLAIWDRVLRFFFGVLLSGWAFAGGPSWAYVGVYFILTSGWGFCPIYSIFKIKTIETDDRLNSSGDN